MDKDIRREKFPNWRKIEKKKLKSGWKIHRQKIISKDSVQQEEAERDITQQDERTGGVFFF